MSSSDFIPYYKKQIASFNKLAELEKDKDKKAFFSSQAKMLSGRMMDIQAEAMKK